jgi:hypothetical protein
MKTVQGSNRGQAAMLSALEQVEELAHELCRPDYSEVDKAIGRYLLETVRPVMQKPAVGQEAPRMLSLGLRLFRLFGRRREPADVQATAVTESVSEHAGTAALECVPMDSFVDVPDPRFEIEERGSHVAVH